MKKKTNPIQLPDEQAIDKTEVDTKEIIFPGYPLYPAAEDIYNKSKKEGDIDPEDISKMKAPNEPAKVGKNNEKDFDEDVSGSDLDVPGSELDDRQEDIGSEDEENNYYSSSQN
ncbi:MAG: hypothetical protein H7Y04_04135 [Verrucomicrobia bacterium]|nr:hypothetical protein [Cytophagales bacterium]